MSMFMERAFLWIYANLSREKEELLDFLQQLQLYAIMT